MATIEKNRRKGPDTTVIIYNKLAILVACINIILIIFVALFRPSTFTMVSKFAKSPAPGTTGGIYNDSIVVLLVIQLVVSIIGLALNSTRHQRKKDHYSLLLSTSLFIAIGALFLTLF